MRVSRVRVRYLSNLSEKDKNKLRLFFRAFKRRSNPRSGNKYIKRLRTSLFNKVFKGGTNE